MIPPLIIRLFGKNEFSKAFGQLQKSIGGAGKKMKSAGRGITTGISLPLAIAGGAAFKMSMDFNKSMANVGTLIPGNKKRLQELKKEVQSLAIETGKSTADIAEGLFQTISAFGDGPETMKKLRVTARAAVGGVAGVADAINLTSLITKAYGDTSAGTTQKVLNLAFMANKLGQTTFPEMAASLGQAVPIAESLGVKIEELFGVMGTFTGVTGNTSIVTTQLTSFMGALVKPTSEMDKIFKALGVKSGPEVIKKFGGLRQAMNAVVLAAKKNNLVLGKVLGRKEALSLVLAATGRVADKFTEKMKDMNTVTAKSGEAEQAFRDQAEGINKAGFAWSQMIVKVSIMGQKLGDVMGEVFLPFIMKVGVLATKFGELSPGVKKFIVIAGVLVIALGPLLFILGSIAIAVAAISWPVVLVVAGIMLLGAAITFIVIKWKTWGKWIKRIGFGLLLLSGPIGILVAGIILIHKKWDKLIGGFKLGLKVVKKVGGFIKGISLRGYSCTANLLPKGDPRSQGIISNQARVVNTNNAKLEVKVTSDKDNIETNVSEDADFLEVDRGLMTAGAG